MALHGSLQLPGCVRRWSGPNFDKVESDNGDERLVEADGHYPVDVLSITDTKSDLSRVSFDRVEESELENGISTTADGLLILSHDLLS